MTTPHLSDLAARFELILGSGSPRRVRLLAETGVPYRQVIPQVDETAQPGEPPLDYAVRLARSKAEAVSQRLGRNSVVLGCDTIVILDDAILEKPVDEPDAFRILSLLSGQRHRVCTSAALAHSGATLVSGCDVTDVYFNEVTPEQILEYIATGEPMDKAGAYGIQGQGGFLVDRIEGSLDTVIGLPRKLLDELAANALAALAKR
jgi:septum formation protein